MAQMSVEETIRMLRTPNPEEVAQQLEQEMQYYNNVKGLEGPFIESIRSGFERINQIYKDEGLEPPFVLNYSDLQDVLNEEREKLRELEELREEVHNKYSQVEVDAQKYKGTTYSEVQEKKAEYQKQWDEYNVQISNLQSHLNEMNSYISTFTEETFNQQSNTYEYLYQKYHEATSDRLKDSISKKYIRDEITTNQIQMELFGISKNLESLKSKQEVLKDKEAKIKELAASIGVELADFSFEAITKEEVKDEQIEQAQEVEEVDKVEEVQEIEKAEEVHEEKPEHLEPIEEEKVEIKTVNELIEELKKLNPDAEITATMDGKINSKVRLSALALPEGFHYDEKLGITNKGEGVDYIAAEPGNVPEEEKVEEKAPDVVEEEVEKVEEAPVEEPVEKAPVAQNNSDSDSKEKEKVDNKEKTDAKESKIPLGERFKVTAARAAVASPFIKSALIGYAITGMVTASWLLPSALIGAGLGVGIQALYKKAVKKNFAKEDIPVLTTITDKEKRLDEYTAFVGPIRLVHQNIKDLINDFKEYRSSKIRGQGLQEIYNNGVKKGIEEAAPVKAPEQQVSVTPEQPVVNEIPVQPENLDDAGDSSTSPVTPVEEVIEPVVSQVTPAEVNEKEAKIGNMIEALRNGTATEEEKDQIRVAVDGGLITDSALVEEVNGLLTGRGL